MSSGSSKQPSQPIPPNETSWRESSREPDMKDDRADPPGDLSAEPDDDAPDELPWFTEDELP